jgi:phosphatidylinositol-3-phosphatase
MADQTKARGTRRPTPNSGARRYPRWLAVAALVSVAAVVAAEPAATAARRTPARPRGAQAKVMVIAEENHAYGQIIGSSAAPYLNHLATTYTSVTAMDAGYPTRCPSLAAYVLMTSGSTHGICDDQGPVHHPLSGDNIFAQVAAAGLTWRNYAEHAPTPCARTNSADGVFLVRHTPAPYYVSERRRCPVADVPLGTPARGALQHDVRAGTLPAYAYVTPDACHDMHGAAACPDSGTADGDSWLRRWLPLILAGPDFRAGRLLVMITWDEGTAATNHIPLLLVAAHRVRPSSSGRYTHCSTLATAEAVLRLPRLGCAGTAPPFVTRVP